ncbi:hypothetical protein CTAYLR_009476 [Chrysophaeum taylorii]|uniref:Methyltransferase domain-containing protein n=1 Tax=Chrysophaeum taylorii TaxID=2483200 RepID=A0AAD7UIG2_9STRA|nr:hypothetical protein CTAYLR_009476 [Chrysophaeum taylorii]
MRVVQFPKSEDEPLVAGEVAVSPRVEGRCVVEGPGEGEFAGRVRVSWEDGSVYHARRGSLQRLYDGLVVVARTEAFRALAAQVSREDAVLELGCSAGAATRLLVRRARTVVAVDKSKEMIRAAKDRAPGATFLQMDVLRDDAWDASEADVVFLDLGGVGALDHSATLLKRLLGRRDPRLVVVKSRELAACLAAAFHGDPVMHLVLADLLRAVFRQACLKAKRDTQIRVKDDHADEHNNNQDSGQLTMTTEPFP